MSELERDDWKGAFERCSMMLAAKTKEAERFRELFEKAIKEIERKDGVILKLVRALTKAIEGIGDVAKSGDWKEAHVMANVMSAALRDATEGDDGRE